MSRNTQEDSAGVPMKNLPYKCRKIISLIRKRGIAENIPHPSKQEETYENKNIT